MSQVLIGIGTISVAFDIYGDITTANVGNIVTKNGEFHRNPRKKYCMFAFILTMAVYKYRLLSI